MIKNHAKIEESAARGRKILVPHHVLHHDVERGVRRGDNLLHCDYLRSLQNRTGI